VTFVIVVSGTESQISSKSGVTWLERHYRRIFYEVVVAVNTLLLVNVVCNLHLTACETLT
jgi:hypothetical protein